MYTASDSDQCFCPYYTSSFSLYPATVHQFVSSFKFLELVSATVHQFSVPSACIQSQYTNFYPVLCSFSLYSATVHQVVSSLKLLQLVSSHNLYTILYPVFISFSLYPGEKNTPVLSTSRFYPLDSADINLIQLELL